MGGRAYCLKETKNFRWIHIQLSGEYPTYRFYVESKKEPSRDISPREDSFSEGKDYHTLLNDAFDELEKEGGERGAYEAMTKEQITLSEIYHRMVEAEEHYKWQKERADNYEKVINDLHKAYDEIQKEREERKKKG